jgi:hypothetical protein
MYRIAGCSMSNIHIDPMKFINIRTGKESIGFTLYDEYSSAYCDCLEGIPDDDMEFFKLVAEFVAGTSEDGRYNELWEVFIHLRENVQDIFVGNILYDYEDLKGIIDKAFEEYP